MCTVNNPLTQRKSLTCRNGCSVSIQVNDLIRVAVKNRQVRQIGDGTNEWNHVHINDLTDLYLLIFEHALAAKDTPSAYERFYWGSAGTHNWGEITRDLAARLHRRGLIDTTEIKSVTVKDEPKLNTVAANSRTVANRPLKTLGWKPSGKSLKDSLEEEIDLTLTQL